MNTSITLYRQLQLTKVFNWLSLPNLGSLISELSSAYKSIQSTLPSKPWFSDFRIVSRRTIMSICRLGFHHNRLPTNLARFQPDISPHCLLYFHYHILGTANHFFSSTINFPPSFITSKYSSLLPEHLDSGPYYPFFRLGPCRMYRNCPIHISPSF